LSEDEPEELENDDFDNPKDYSPGQLDLIAQALKKAGLHVELAREVEGELQIVFSWPFTGGQMYLNGWNRAASAMAPYIKLRQGNYGISKRLSDTDRRSGVATATIRKPAEENPGLWKIKGQPVHNERFGNIDSPVFYEIFFDGQKVGTAYMPRGVGSQGEEAEALREEMAALNQVIQFIPDQWPAEDEEWDSGPAIHWWRKNRSKLPFPNKNKYHFTNHLLGE
jgi:hypothetical protein